MSSPLGSLLLFALGEPLASRGTKVHFCAPVSGFQATTLLVPSPPQSGTPVTVATTSSLPSLSISPTAGEERRQAGAPRVCSTAPSLGRRILTHLPVLFGLPMGK